MTLKDFKLIKNRQQPLLCYKYERTVDGLKYSIATFNSGKSFHAIIEEQRLDKRWYSKLSKEVETVELCLEAFNNDKEGKV